MKGTRTLRLADLNALAPMMKMTTNTIFSNFEFHFQAISDLRRLDLDVIKIDMIR